MRGAAPHLDAARDIVKDDYGMIASIAYEYRMASEFDSCVKTYDRAVAIKDGGEVRLGRALCLSLIHISRGRPDRRTDGDRHPRPRQGHRLICIDCATSSAVREAPEERGVCLLYTSRCV